MANKDRNKRAARQARQEERARVEAAQASSAPAKEAPKGIAKIAAKPADKKPEAKPVKKADPSKRPGPFKRLRSYLGDVRSEMKRVTWPSKEELKSYSVAIVAMLIVFGVVIWLVDSGIVALLVGFTGLRG